MDRKYQVISGPWDNEYPLSEKHAWLSQIKGDPLSYGPARLFIHTPCPNQKGWSNLATISTNDVMHLLVIHHGHHYFRFNLVFD